MTCEIVNYKVNLQLNFRIRQFQLTGHKKNQFVAQNQKWQKKRKSTHILEEATVAKREKIRRNK